MVLSKSEEKQLQRDKEAIDKVAEQGKLRTLAMLAKYGFQGYSNKINIEIKKYAKQKYQGIKTMSSVCKIVRGKV